MHKRLTGLAIGSCFRVGNGRASFTASRGRELAQWGHGSAFQPYDATTAAQYLLPEMAVLFCLMAELALAVSTH